MDFEQGLEWVDELVFTQVGRRLCQIEVAVLRGSWHEQTYEEIANATGYSVSYLNRTVAPRLWQILSEVLNEKVGKKNFRFCLERGWYRQQQTHPGENVAAQNDRVLSTHRQNQKTEPEPAASTVIAQPSSFSLAQVDWGEAVDVSVFYGREPELKTLTQWVVQERCRLVMILGMGGIGKTVLSVKLAQNIQQHFEFVIWRSLRNAPPLETLLADLITVLSNQQETQSDVRKLLQYLRQARCLVILDNVETILDAEHVGQFQANYEGYSELLRIVGEVAHQSCFVLTSREKLSEIAILEGEPLAVRSLKLLGSKETTQEILAAKQLKGSAIERAELGDRYAHNPLALKMVATSIQDVFGREIRAFLQENTLVFNGIRRLLDQQFNRLSTLEQSIMYWLAINRDATTIAELQTDLIPAVSKTKLLEALEALCGRSLIEKALPTPMNKDSSGSGLSTLIATEHVSSSYTQQPVVMEYVTDRLIEQVTAELMTQTPALLSTHALLKTTVKDYIRDSQARLILDAIADRLVKTLGSSRLITQTVQLLLAQLRAMTPLSQLTNHESLTEATIGYTGGNLLNLCRQLPISLTGYDFSELTIRQAYLQGLDLHQVNFTNANFSQTIFTQTCGSIWSLAFSPDGTRLATVDNKQEVRVWRVADGHLLLTCKGHTSWMFSVAWHPNGKIIASSSQDSTIKLWESQTGKCLKTLQGHTDWVWSITWSPNGNTLASASQDSTIKLWNPQTGECLKTLEGHTEAVSSVAWSPQGHLLATGSYDQTIRLWNPHTGQSVAQLQACEGAVLSLAWHPNGYTLASGTYNHTIQLWDLLWILKDLDVSQGILPAKIGKATNTAFSTESHQSLRGHTGWVSSVAWSPDGQLLASSSQDHTIRLWKPTTETCLKTLKGHTNWVYSVAWSPNDYSLASSSQDQTIKFWDIHTGHSLKTIQGYTNSCLAIAWSPTQQGLDINEHIFAASFQDQTIRLWSRQQGQWLNILRGHRDLIWSVVWSPDGKLLASGSQDQTIKLWDITSGICIKTLSEHLGVVRSIAWHPQGQILASGSQDQTIKLWSVESGHCLMTLQGHTGWSWSVAWSPDGEMLASGSQDQTIKLWEGQTGACLNTFQGHTDTVYQVAWSPDGQVLVSGSQDRTIKLWDIKSGECIQTLEGHTNLISTITWSPDGRFFASSSHDQTIRLWNRQTGQCFSTLQGHTGLIHAVAWHPNQALLVSSSDDEMIKIWDVTTGECLETVRVARPYEGMAITGATGLSQATIDSLLALGAIDQSSKI